MKLSARKHPLKLSTRKQPLKDPLGRKQSRRKAKFKIPQADTGGRNADLVSADTPVACLSQADGSTMSADTPTDLAAQDGASAKLADTPVACLSQTGRSTVTTDMPNGVPVSN